MAAPFSAMFPASLFLASWFDPLTHRIAAARGETE
jgi:hypothetical protein